MLTSLDFIQTGKPWPPEDKDEVDRLKEHAFNRCVYNNQHEVFSKYAAYLQDKEDDDKKVMIVLGWGEKATTTYVNLCIGEAPDVEINDEDVIEERPDEEVLIDVSRYGFGLYEPTQDGIFAQNPETCYLVNAPGNIRKVTKYVFFSVFPSGKTSLVKFTIHGKGFIQHLLYEIKEEKVDGRTEVKLGDKQNLANYPAYAGLKVDPETGIQKTGVDDILIVRVDNALSSERRYGRSDYTPSVCSLMEALELAFSRREEVLAKFARPVLQAGESAANHFNHAKQKWEIHLDEPIMLEPGSVEAKYLTWEAQLDAVEKAIQDKMDQLLQMLDLVKQEELGKAESGTALAFRLIPTTSRVRKFATGLKKAIPKVHSLYSKLSVALGKGGKAVEPQDVSVVFQDGIPRDPVQEATWATQAFMNQGMSLETYVCITQDLEMSDDPESALQKEVARIRGAQQAQQQAAPAAPVIELPALGETNAGQQPTQ
jgi:hypothetical protein